VVYRISSRVALGVVKALVLNCTLKRSPQESNTEALARVVVDALRREGVECEVIRVVDFHIAPGVSSDEGDGDEWPAMREKILSSELFVLASPTWLALEHRQAGPGAHGRDALRKRRRGAPGCL
jgi:NADPH-dependent FMN reductase